MSRRLKDIVERIKHIESELGPLEAKMADIEQSGTGIERAALSSQISRRQIELPNLLEKYRALKTRINTRKNKHMRAGKRRRTLRGKRT
jgi:uncharacterized protein (UPF0335 family)